MHRVPMPFTHYGYCALTFMATYVTVGNAQRGYAWSALLGFALFFVFGCAAVLSRPWTSWKEEPPHV